MWTNSNLHSNHTWPTPAVWGEEKGEITPGDFFFFPGRNVNLIFFLNKTQSSLDFLDIKINSKKVDTDKHPNC